MTSETQNMSFPDNDISLLSNDESINTLANFSQYVPNDSFIIKESTNEGFEYLEESVVSNGPATWNGHGFKPQNTDFKGSLPDYRCSSELPIDYFHMFLAKSMIEEIVLSTNYYANQREISLKATYDEIEQYIGVLLHMGVVTMPDYRMYWHFRTKYCPISNVFSRKRFDQIKSNFHIGYNDQANYDGDSYDPLLKVRALYTHVQDNCKILEVPEYLSIGII